MTDAEAQKGNIPGRFSDSRQCLEKRGCFENHELALDTYDRL